MRKYLNPGMGAFEEAVNSEIFIDKTEMIGYLNTVVKTNKKYVSVSRPRRFGKTMAANMVCAYYDREADSRTLFENRKLAGVDDWDKYLGKFDVIRLQMHRVFKAGIPVSDALERMQALVIREMKKVYPEASLFDDKDLIQSIDDIYTSIDKQVVIVIDEWDICFRERSDDQDGQRMYLDFLRDLLKDNECIALAYMTGILPIKKYGMHSALNMFTEYSMMAPMQLAPYTGFTEEEVQELSRKYEMDYGEIANRYDGYLVSDRIPTEMREEYRKGMYSDNRFSVYCPLSIVQAMTLGVIRNYWNQTETYEALAEYIRKDYDGLKEAVALLMDGGRLAINTGTYQNDMITFTGKDDVLSLLVHLGYLGFDDERSEVFIPNREILEEFKNSTTGKALRTSLFACSEMP